MSSAPSARQISTASSNYPLVCPVTAVAPKVPTPKSPPPRQPTSDPDARPFSLDSADIQLQPSPLAPPFQLVYAHARAFPSKEGDSPDEEPFRSVRLTDETTTATEFDSHIPWINFPNFRSVFEKSARNNYQIEIPERTPTPRIDIEPKGPQPVLPAPPQERPERTPLESSPSQIVGPRPQYELSALARGAAREVVSPSLRSKVISLAELERRLSVASLPLSVFPFRATLHKSNANSVDNFKHQSSRTLHKRRYSADDMQTPDWWETVSTRLGWNQGRPAAKPQRSQRRHRVRDDVTADWSSVISTEESVSYYALKKRGNNSKRRVRAVAGASMYHPPQATALAPRYAVPPMYGPLLPAAVIPENCALTPVASRSLLTCSSDFKKHYPFVYQGLCKGILDIQRLIAHEIVVPIKEEVSLRRSTIRSRKAVTNAICDQLWRSLQGKFPDPSVAPKIIRKMADYFYDKIEYGIQDAEDERSFLQWLFRFDVENAIDLRQNTTINVGKNSVLCNVEGSAHLKRRKGDFFNMVSPDSVTLNIELVIKALFLNGGHLLEINSDSRFIDRVSAGENRFAQNFLML